MTARPSKAQRRIMELMSEGEKLHVTCGIDAHVFLSGRGLLGVRFSTLDVMNRRGWLTVTQQDWRGHTYILSTAGKKALELTRQGGRNEKNGTQAQDTEK